MFTFPVTSSVISAAHLNEFLKQQFGFANDSTCSLIKAGVNHSYLVTNGIDKYIYRIYCYNWRTELEIAEELRFINHLHQNNIGVSYPILDKNGKYIHEIMAPEGKRFGVLFSFAEGEKQFHFDLETQFKMGENMALIHKYSSEINLQRTPYTVDNLLISSFEFLKKHISIDTPEMQSMVQMQKYLINEYNHANTENIRQGVVHLDIWFDNLHIDTNNKITIFDFDFCGNGWVCLDMAYYLMQLHVLELDDNLYKQKTEMFLNGYESVTILSEEEKRLLPLLGVCLYFFYLGVQSARFEDYSNMFLNETYLKRYIPLRVKKYFDYHQLG